MTSHPAPACPAGYTPTTPVMVAPVPGTPGAARYAVVVHPTLTREAWVSVLHRDGTIECVPPTRVTPVRPPAPRLVPIPAHGEATARALALLEAATTAQAAADTYNRPGADPAAVRVLENLALTFRRRSALARRDEEGHRAA